MSKNEMIKKYQEFESCFKTAPFPFVLVESKIISSEHFEFSPIYENRVFSDFSKKITIHEYKNFFSFCSQMIPGATVFFSDVSLHSVSRSFSFLYNGSLAVNMYAWHVKKNTFAVQFLDGFPMIIDSSQSTRICDEELLLENESQISQKSEKKRNGILVVDDSRMNRIFFKKIFKDKYNLFEAEDGAEGLHILNNNAGEIDIVILDLVMPKVDGREFLRWKKRISDIADIPVIVVSASDIPQHQTEVFELGAKDFLAQPINPSILLSRIESLLQVSQRMQQLFIERKNFYKKAVTDQMTSLYNKTTAENLIRLKMKECDESINNVLFIVDVDNFKGVNDKYGHLFGDKALRHVAECIKSVFREEDVMGRIGGDEFIIFLYNIDDKSVIEKKAWTLSKKIQMLNLPQKGENLSCSIGIAINDTAEEDFDTLFRKADYALYTSKERSKNTVSFYEKKDDF